MIPPERVHELAADRVPFVRATVVRAQVPTSAQPGDVAIVMADGTVEGFVGGQCAEGSVRTAALRTLHEQRSVLLRVLPEAEAGFPEAPGAEVVVNPCLSGGALEMFLEPMLPPPILWVLGDTPIADALVTVASVLGWATTREGSESNPLALVVATHGGEEAAAVRAALDAGVGHVAVVASRTRGAALLDEMGLTRAERARVHTPAGIDIGARTPPEVALSILADLVAAVRRGGLRAPQPETATSAAPPTAVDPVCGMTVSPVASTPHLDVDGAERIYFCSTGCRDAHARTLAG